MLCINTHQCANSQERKGLHGDFRLLPSDHTSNHHEDDAQRPRTSHVHWVYSVGVEE